MESGNLDSASVQTYLDRGADINYRDEYRDTVLSLALNWSADDVAIALVDAGADLSIRDGDDLTPIEHAVTYGADISVIRAMLRNGASLDFEIDGMSLLEYAREYGYEELESFLMQGDELQSSAR
jgi:ankyrin repeat protein